MKAQRLISVPFDRRQKQFQRHQEPWCPFRSAANLDGKPENLNNKPQMAGVRDVKPGHTGALILTFANMSNMPFKPVKKTQPATADRTVRRIQGMNRMAPTRNKCDDCTPSSKEGIVRMETEFRTNPVEKALTRPSRRRLTRKKAKTELRPKNITRMANTKFRSKKIKRIEKTKFCLNYQRRTLITRMAPVRRRIVQSIHSTTPAM